LETFFEKNIVNQNRRDKMVPTTCKQAARNRQSVGGKYF
jgi:hypothetical protein